MDKPLDNLCKISFKCDRLLASKEAGCVYYRPDDINKHLSAISYCKHEGGGQCESAVANVNRMVLSLKKMGVFVETKK